MNNKDKLKFVVILLAVYLVFASPFILLLLGAANMGNKMGLSSGRWDGTQAKDTVILYDTVFIKVPTATYETDVRVDTVWLERVTGFAPDKNVASKPEESTFITDSVEVVIPITQKVYEDSTYKAWVSGYKPSLDSINVYRRETYIPVVMEVKKRPKIVVSAGVYCGFGAKGADYGVGITVGIPIWCW